MNQLATQRYRREITLLLSAALVIFVVTVIIGILNGADLVEFDIKTILTHVHAGTLGWITIAVFASVLWLFGDGEVSGWQEALPGLLTPLSVVVIAVYVVAFWTTVGTFRPVMGTITGLVIAAYFVWTVARARRRVLSTPHWGMLVALFTSVTGAVFGVLYAFMISTGHRLLPEGGEDAHPATMVVGFLLPVGMSVTEWWLRPDTLSTPADRAGLWQMGSLLAGSVILVVGLLLDAPPLIGLSLPLEIVAVVLFLVRNGRAMRATDWAEPSPARFFTFSALAIVANIVYFAYLVIRYEGDFDLVPTRLLLVLDHMMFVGVMTMAIFGLLTAITAERRGVLTWADQWIFWLTTCGLVGFMLGLLADLAWMKRVSTPAMGVGILLGLLTFGFRLRAVIEADPEGSPA
ncbi:MAG: hypothetical protein M5U31_05135 [Acidimicrobiia bacterium]|nr:hypothetical protein [Acidimicrobiia bacterium]